VDGIAPIEYDLATGNLGFVHDTGRLGLKIDTAVAHYNYHNGLTGNGQTILETNRNMTEYAITLRVTYEIVPGYHAFVQATGDKRDYEDRLGPGGFERSSRGYEASVGTAIRLGPTLNGELFVGYLQQDYDDPRLRPASGIGFGGSLLWNVTRLTSVRATL